MSDDTQAVTWLALSKPQRPDQPSAKRDTDCRCFDIAEEEAPEKKEAE